MSDDCKCGHREVDHNMACTDRFCACLEYELAAVNE